MKGCEPHISKRLRKLFVRHNYEVFRINEFRTSKLCHVCRGEMERFLWVMDKNGNLRLLWKLLRCKTVKCEAIHNRDVNAARNMLNITKNILAGKGRPAEFTRKNPA
jgi:transposase